MSIIITIITIIINVAPAVAIIIITFGIITTSSIKTFRAQTNGPLLLVGPGTYWTSSPGAQPR